MDFRIAETFTGSLAQLTSDEQRAATTTAFDPHVNLASPGMQFHKLDKAKDRNFWSVRAGADLRLIEHRSEGCLLLCYVDHHDAAYRWAEPRRLGRHPTTGAAGLVEIRETVRETVRVVEVPRVEAVEAPAPVAATAAAASRRAQVAPGRRSLVNGLQRVLRALRHAGRRIAVKVIDPLRDEVMRGFRV